ncbi:flagellar hook-basal body complex subunit FliE [Desulforamulus reducens MI-1]|uniref:Flagellar hook-basal body complex protein FliE n=1 Tax=Desulforamulus reducens (strain ATCC BAA-1160 / DSM 100696 / MI-1) TaxID=349161 RepID=A4J766_DESRM|nr:flagellar hook-basal body complex protein FliE [Desulforamulus reducens]ABO50919.1 flagellar hook-basal body complex subunit FliE [Desulforamulus reducens MI-1]
MNILPVATPLQVSETTSANKYAGPADFGGVLNKAISKLNDTQIQADDVMQKFLVGEVQDIHQVTVAMQEAKLTMQLAVEVRNKIVEAYQEISRIQL